MAKKHFSRTVLERFMTLEQINKLEQEYSQNVHTGGDREQIFNQPITDDEKEAVKEYITDYSQSVREFAKKRGITPSRYHGLVLRGMKKLVYINRDKLL